MLKFDLQNLFWTCKNFVSADNDNALWQDRKYHETYNRGSQYFQHACSGTRGLYLRGYHHRGVLQGHGSEREYDGRLHFSMGRGFERDLGAVGRNARRQRLPCLLGSQVGILLREGRKGQLYRVAQQKRKCHHCRSVSIFSPISLKHLARRDRPKSAPP